MHRAIQFWVHLWERLTRPRADIEELDRRHQARILAGLLLLIIVVGWLSFVPIFLFEMQAVVENPLDYVVIPAILLVVLQGLYLLSRTRRYSLAALIAIIIVSVAIFFLAIPTNGQSGEVAMLSYLIVPLMLSSILFTQQVVGLLVIGYVVAMVVFYAALPAYPETSDVPLYLIIMAGGTTMLIARYRNTLEANRRAVLEKSEARYRLLVDRSPYAILICQGSAITFCNEAGGRLLGDGCTDRVVGQAIWALVDAASESVLRTYLDTAKADEQAAPPLEVLARRANAETFAAELTAIPLHDLTPNSELPHCGATHSQQETSMLLVVRDITARQSLEEQRLALAIERQRVKIVTDFISDASHEFRTPLSVINATQYLLEHQAAPDRQPEQFAILRNQVNAIVLLVESMLTMTRLDSGVPLEFLPLNVNSILHDLRTSQMSVAAAKQLDLRFDLAPDLPLVQANRTELHRALANLLDNAIRFTPEQGRITVSTAAGPHHVLVEISDSGRGIEPEALPHIFESMYRGDGARTERAAGLGLPIARTVVELHGGHIEAESAPGQGTTFRVCLPLPATGSSSNTF